MQISAPTATIQKLLFRYSFRISLIRYPNIFTSEIPKLERSIITFIIRYMTTQKINADIIIRVETIGIIIFTKISEFFSTSDFFNVP